MAARATAIRANAMHARVTANCCMVNAADATSCNWGQYYIATAISPVSSLFATWALLLMQSGASALRQYSSTTSLTSTVTREVTPFSGSGHTMLSPIADHILAPSSPWVNHFFFFLLFFFLAALLLLPPAAVLLLLLGPAMVLDIWRCCKGVGEGA